MSCSSRLKLKRRQIFFLHISIFSKSCKTFYCYWASCMQLGAELGGCKGATAPQNFARPPHWPPKLRSFSVGLFLKVLHRPLTAPLLQNWLLQWPPQMKMSGSAPACSPTLSQISIDILLPAAQTFGLKLA